MEDIILKLEGIGKSFGAVRVLDGVNLTLRKGSILGVVGENGAGKSTLMNILGGIYRRDGGKMLLDGKPYDPQTPLDAKRNGIAFIHQELSLFENLSVKENLFIDELPTRMGVFVDRREMAKRADKALSSLGLDIDKNKLISAYGMGIRQLTEIAKALLRDVRILIFDEPTTSLSNREKERLFEVIEGLRRNGVSIIYISHVLEDVFRLCDDILVLRDGSVIGQKPKDELTMNSVVSMMVGRELTSLYPYVKREIGPLVLEVKGLTAKGFKGVSFDVRSGELVGVFGLIGAGRSEVARCVFGLDAAESGYVEVNGNRLSHDPIKSIKAGVAFVTENRKEEGLLLNKTVRDNLALVSLDERKRAFSFVDEAAETNLALRMVDFLRIKTHDPNSQTAGQLSGGNQQKVVIGKWLAKSPKVFILDEPTRGVDVGAKFEIYNRINDLAINRTAVLMISSEIEELMGICDRILVMAAGRVTADVDRSEFDQRGIMELAIKRGEKS